MRKLNFTFANRLDPMKTPIVAKLIIVSILLLASIPNGFAQSATLTVNQDPKIPELLSAKKEMEKENKLSEGFTIQLYYGELDKANQILSKYKGNYGQWPASIEYETPNYKVWAGSFSSRLDAERALMDIHKNFPSAFILKPERRK